MTRAAYMQAVENLEKKYSDLIEKKRLAYYAKIKKEKEIYDKMIQKEHDKFMEKINILDNEKIKKQLELSKETGNSFISHFDTL